VHAVQEVLELQEVFLPGNHYTVFHSDLNLKLAFKIRSKYRVTIST